MKWQGFEIHNNLKKIEEDKISNQFVLEITSELVINLELFSIN